MRNTPGWVGSRPSPVMQRKVFHLLLFCLLGCAGGLPAAAAMPQAVTPLLIPVSQARSVVTSAVSGDMYGRQTDDDSMVAPDFAPFDAEVRSDTVQSHAFAIAGSVQHSAIRAQEISADGSASFSLSITDQQAEFATAEATSSFFLTFRTNVATLVRLRGTLSAATPDGTIAGYASVELAGSSGSIFAKSSNTDAYHETFDVLLALERGEMYSLSALGFGSGVAGIEYSTKDSSATYSLTLSVVPAVREFTAMSHLRTIGSHALATESSGAVSDDDLAEAPDAAPWEAAVQSEAERGGALARSDASQTSTINATRMTVAGRARGIGNIRNAGEFASGSANSAFEVRFFVGAPTTILLKGGVASVETGTGDALVHVALSDEAGTSLFMKEGKSSFHHLVRLKAGQIYLLTASVQAVGQTLNDVRFGTGTGGFQVTMELRDD